MEGLIELVAASFARHGIECRANDSPLVLGRTLSPAHAETAASGSPAECKSAAAFDPVALSAEPPLTTALPEHNYRKTSQGDPAP
jgi:hypothetical protein